MSILISHSAFWLLSVFGIGLNSCAQDEKVNEPQEATTNIKKEINMENKMKVEIWSDVMCPFCYIGKRNFETALEQFKDKEHILDIGCGRGEFIELLMDEGKTDVKGIDLNDDMVIYCKEQGLPVEKIDALSYLKEIKKAKKRN